jgi:hypothetical protein
MAGTLVCSQSLLTVSSRNRNKAQRRAHKIHREAVRDVSGFMVQKRKVSDAIDASHDHLDTASGRPAKGR